MKAESETPESGERDLLARRAAALARPLSQVQAGERLRVIGFQLAWERYAIDAAFVRQVVVLRKLARLPGVERPLHGITSWRGDLLTVLDLRSVLGLTEAGLTDLSRLLVIGRTNALFGLVVDAVAAATEIDPEDLTAPPSPGGKADPLIQGVTPEGFILLDARELIERYTQT